MRNSKNNIIKQGAISGVVASLLYFGAALLDSIPDKAAMYMGIAFPLFMLSSFIGLYHYFKKDKISMSIELAYLFGLFASIIACAFIVIQQANIVWHDDALILNNTQKNTHLNDVYRAVNRVQLALDIVFDIFLCLAVFLFGINVIKSPKFKPIFGWIGCVLAVALLVINLYAFPNPPSSSGLLDLGPYVGIWMLILYLWLLNIMHKSSAYKTI